MTNGELCALLADYPYTAEVGVWLDRYEWRDCERCGEPAWLILDGGYAVAGVQELRDGQQGKRAAALLLEVGEPL